MTPAWWKTILDGAHQYETQSGAGTITPDATIVYITTTAADALVLSDGEAGQHVFLTMVVDGGVGTLTPTNIQGYATIAFDDIGDYVCLRFNGRAWEVVAWRGVTLA